MTSSLASKYNYINVNSGVSKNRKLNIQLSFFVFVIKVMNETISLVVALLPSALFLKKAKFSHSPQKTYNRQLFFSLLID